MDHDHYGRGKPLTREGLFQLLADEAYIDGVIEDWEEKILSQVACFIGLGADAAQAITKGSFEKYTRGGLGLARPMHKLIVYKKAIFFALSDCELDDLETHMLGGLRQLFAVSDEDHVKILESLGLEPPTEDERAAASACHAAADSAADPEPPREPKELEAAARAGARRAQYELSLCFLYGKGSFCRNPGEAVTWLERAAAQGFAPAMYDQGTMYWTLHRQGQASEEQLTRGWKAIRGAAKLGHVEAQVTLGKLLTAGEGPSKDREEGLSWLRRVADGGNPSGLYHLGRVIFGAHIDDLSYLTCASKAGEPALSSEEAEGFVILEKAARAGHAEAQFRVACLHWDGHELSEQALQWMKAASAQGHKGAAAVLARLSKEGL